MATYLFLLSDKGKAHTVYPLNPGSGEKSFFIQKNLGKGK